MDLSKYFETASKLDSFMPSLGDTFLKLLESVMTGDEELGLKIIWELFLSTIQTNINQTKEVFVTILLLGIVTAFLKNFAQVLKNKQISDLSFYLTYLFLMTLLLNVFYTIVETALGMIETIVQFTEILIPIYYIAVAATAAVKTAASFYQLTILLLYAAQVIFPELIVPLISCFVFCSVVNGVTGDERLTPLLTLLQKSVQFLMRLAIGAVSGISVIKSMVSPAVDGLKITAFQKTFSVIPGIGEVTESVSKVVIGSAVLIKNSLGFSILILLVILCIVPVLKILILAAMLRVCAAFLGILGESRTTSCLEKVSDGAFLMLKASLCVVLILFITIAVAGAACEKVV